MTLKGTLLLRDLRELMVMGTRLRIIFMLIRKANCARLMKNRKQRFLLTLYSQTSLITLVLSAHLWQEILVCLTPNLSLIILAQPFVLNLLGQQTFQQKNHWKKWGSLKA